MTAVPLRDRLIGGVIGTLVGDALGVPVEFTARSARDADPVQGMRGHGTWNQPAGTWSDDSSMTLVAAAVLALNGWDLPGMMDGFLRWLDAGEWTAHGAVFDIGNRTRNSIMLYRIDRDWTACGGDDEGDNGNGSLMRCMPVSCWLFGNGLAGQLEAAGQASALTHAHLRSRLCCAWHALWCDAVLSGRDVRTATRTANDLLRRHVPASELPCLARILDGSILDVARSAVLSDGYVVSTLQASLWCLAQQRDYPATVLAAVNLGGDADTTAAVAGGMAGLRYGASAIPEAWIAARARRDDVLALAGRFADACLDHWAACGARAERLARAAAPTACSGRR